VFIGGPFGSSHGTESPDSLGAAELSLQLEIHRAIVASLEPVIALIYFLI